MHNQEEQEINKWYGEELSKLMTEYSKKLRGERIKRGLRRRKEAGSKIR